MNKMIKMASGLALSLVISCNLIVFTTSALNCDNGKLKINNYIQQIISEEKMGKVLEYEKLFNDDGSVSAYCLEFKRGYIIVDLYGELVEYSEEMKSPFYNSDEKIYYSGPLSYYTKSNTVYTNVLSNEKISKKAFSSKSYSFKNITQKANKLTGNVSDETITFSLDKTKVSDIQNTLATTTATSALRKNKTALSNKPRCFDYYTDGMCGRVAATTLLFYYEDYIDSKMVNSTYQNNPSKLYSYFTKHNYFPYYSSYDQIRNGFNSTFNVISNTSKDVIIVNNSSATANNTWGNYNYIISSKRIPAILLLQDHPSYGDHWVVTYGVIAYYDSNNKIAKRQYVVNNGFQKNDVKIGSQYADGFIYFN